MSNPRRAALRGTKAERPTLRKTRELALEEFLHQRLRQTWPRVRPGCEHQLPMQLHAEHFGQDDRRGWMHPP